MEGRQKGDREGDSVTTQERQLAQVFRQELQALLGDRLVNVRMYGSRTRGDARRDSDLDILVLLRGQPEPALRYQIYDLAHDLSASRDFQVPLAPLVMSHGDFQELRSRERRFAQEVERDGVVL